MDRAKTGTGIERRRPIPRPWLEKRRLSAETTQLGMKLQIPPQHQQQQPQQRLELHPQYKQQQQKQQPQQQNQRHSNDDMFWKSNDYEFDDEDELYPQHHQFQRPIFLLEKPDVRKSLFSLDCCFPSRIRNGMNASSNTNTSHDRGKPDDKGHTFDSYFHESSTTVVYPPPPPPPPPPPNGHVQRPQPVVRDTSSRWFTPTPTVIYVIHHGGPCDVPSQDDIHQWHQSFLSSQQQHLPPLPLNRDRIPSYDTGMTSLSCDDSLAFSDNPRLAPKPMSSTASVSRQGPRPGRNQHQRTATTTNAASLSIPRPPPMTRKAQTTSSGLPPMARVPQSSTGGAQHAALPLLPQSQRPAGIRTRAATTGSVSSMGSASSRHRRSPGLMDVLDSTALSRIIQQDGKGDGYHDDFDDETIASSEGDSPIFPFLPAVSTASLLSGNENMSLLPSFPQQSHSYVPSAEEVYLPKCEALESKLLNDNAAVASVPLLSGWLAYSLGDSLLHKRHLTRQHLAYMMMDELTGEIHFRQPPQKHHQHDDHQYAQQSVSSSSGQESGEDKLPCKASPPSESFSTVVFTLPRGNDKNHKISVQTLESQGGAGRSVVIRNTHENKTLLTLLPINLSSNEFCCETGRILSRTLLMNATKNNMHGNSLSLAGSVAQHDAALYLWFGLDGWVRRQEQRRQQLQHEQRKQ